MADEQIYLNFPVSLLSGAFINIRKVMDDALNYAGYRHAQTLGFGTKKKRMDDTGEYFGITWGNAELVYQNGERICNGMPGNAPHVGINKNMLFDFYKNPKTEDEIAVLLGYLAIKSILGAKPFMRITNKFMIARMGGYTAIADMPDPLPDPLARYATRRRLDRIKFELQDAWNVNIYSQYVRGFFVSLDKTTPLKELVKHVERERKATREKQLKNKIDEARKDALQELFPPY